MKDLGATTDHVHVDALLHLLAGLLLWHFGVTHEDDGHNHLFLLDLNRYRQYLHLSFLIFLETLKTALERCQGKVRTRHILVIVLVGLSLVFFPLPDLLGIDAVQQVDVGCTQFSEPFGFSLVVSIELVDLLDQFDCHLFLVAQTSLLVFLV